MVNPLEKALSGEEENERVTPKTVTLRLWLDSWSGGHVIKWRCVWTIMGLCVAVKLYGSSSNIRDSHSGGSRFNPRCQPNNLAMVFSGLHIAPRRMTDWNFISNFPESSCPLSYVFVLSQGSGPCVELITHHRNSSIVLSKIYVTLIIS